MADHDETRIEITKRFDNERESKQKEHEKEMELQNELHDRPQENNVKQMLAKHEMQIAKQSRVGETRQTSRWFRFGKWAGFEKKFENATAENEASLKKKHEESLRDIEEKLISGTNDLLNLKVRVASDTQLEATGPLLFSADPQHVKGENQPTKSGNDESFVAKGGETASEMKASVTMNVAGRDVRDTENEPSLKESLERRTHNIQREQESYGIPPNELRLVIIGKSGNGKSSTANTIIGTDFFETGATATSITKETDTFRASRFGKEILLVDTPGLFDPEIERKETEKEISKCMYMTLPGFHAFLLVVRVGRFTAEEMNTVKEFENLFGEKLYDFMIIVFTRADELFREKKTLDDFVRGDIPPNLKQIIERCNHRFVGLNNLGSTASKQKATKNLLEMIETMIDSKDPNHYTNEAFEKAEKDLRETIQAEKERMKAAKRTEFEAMFAEKEKKMREEQVINIKEMKDAWDKEIKQLEENTNRRLDKERKIMEASFNAKTATMLEKERKARDALLNQQREESERNVKHIMDKFEKEMKGIKDDKAKKEMLANKLKDSLELEKEKTVKFYEGVARKEKEDKAMYVKLLADHEKRLSDQTKMFNNERKSKQKEHEQTMEQHNALYERFIEEQHERMTLEHELHIAKEARVETTRTKSKWFRFGKWAGWHE